MGYAGHGSIEKLPTKYHGFVERINNVSNAL